MTDSSDEWPPEQYRLAPNDYLAAFGQVTLVYNFLESMMANIFEHFLPVDKKYSRKLFHEMNNRERMGLLTEIVKEAEKDAAVREAVLSCIVRYDICTDNRNILMHSIYFNPDDKTTRLVKRARKDPGREIHFDVPLTQLRLVADETIETFRYALNLHGFVSRRAWITENPEVNKIGNPFPEQPPKVTKLQPYQSTR